MALSCPNVLRSHLGSDFEYTYLDLVSIYGEDLSDEILLDEFADYLSDAAMSPLADDRVIELSCAALEDLCRAPGIDRMSQVYGHVLARLSPRVLERLRSYFGPEVENLVAEIEEDEALASAAPPAPTGGPSL